AQRRRRRAVLRAQGVGSTADAGAQPRPPPALHRLLSPQARGQPARRAAGAVQRRARRGPALKPLRLELEGFTSFRDGTVLELEGLDLFAITGPTGAGKSSLIDAMVFALYGQVPRV